MRIGQLCALMLFMQLNPSDTISTIQAQEIIREIVSGGTIIFSHHAKEKMLERGYTSHDIEHILLHGEVIKKEFKDHTKTWSYKISGVDLEGDDGAVIVAIVKRLSAVIITVLG